MADLCTDYLWRSSRSLSLFFTFRSNDNRGTLSGIIRRTLSIYLRRFGTWGILITPFLWTAIEFLRFWLTGNNWNAIAYSQAFNPLTLSLASLGGIYLVGFCCSVFNASYAVVVIKRNKSSSYVAAIPLLLLILINSYGLYELKTGLPDESKKEEANIIAIQPNVPMSSIGYSEWKRLRERHVQLAERELAKLKTENSTLKSIVIFPESPMNFGYTRDRDFQAFLKEFTQKNNVQVLFNAAEPSDNNNFYNSAVLVDEKGEKLAQYDKIHLVPFGEYVPLPEPLASLVPSMVGNFEIGKEYDIVPLGDVNAGIMICFESHFPTLSRQFVLNGADVLVEMTNDGYLGETPILRQHLANAVFRAVETNRPILRVTNVGITGYINERGEILDATKPYTEDTRVWSVAKSDGSQTFYFKYGDWFAWLCSIISLAVLFWSFRKRKSLETLQKPARE